MTGTHGRRLVRGFSMVELVIVVAITLIVAAIAIPGILTAAQNYRLRSTASSLSGVIQKCRMLSVARNGTFPVISVTSGGTTTVFVDLNGNGSSDLAEENTTTLALPRGIAFDTGGGGHPSGASIAGSLTSVTGLPRFTPRGLPCFVSSGACKVDPSKMYIAYISQDRSVGGTGWAAVSVTPAGRVQVWAWSGSQWQ